MQATAKDLRFHSKELLDSVKRGEEVVITYRGKPCAKLVPLAEGEVQDLSGADELFGIWQDNTQVDDVEGYVREMRKGRCVAD